jgi:predicted Zn-dependent protease
MNRPIDGIDIDGLEWSSQTFDEAYFGKTMKRVSYLDVNIKIINNSSLTSAEITNIQKEVRSQFGSTFSNFDSNTRRQFIAEEKDISIQNVDDKIDRKFNGLVIEITDEMIFESKVPYVGKTSNSSGRNVSSQHNHINIVNKNSSTSQMAQTILHELGHAAGLDHIWESRVYNIDGTVFSLGAPQDIFDLNEEVKFEFPFEQVEVERPDGGPPTLIPVLRPSKKKKAIFDNLMNSPGNIHRLNIPPLEYTRELRTTISQLIQMNRKIESEDKN